MTSENFVPLIGESRINLLLTFRFFLFFLDEQAPGRVEFR
jgi:hypothetical protein